MNFLDVMTADLTKEEFRVIRSVGWRVCVTVFICFAMGWMTPLGVAGFAKAADMEKKAQALQVSLDVLAHKLDVISNAQTHQSLQVLSAAIIDAQLKKCKANKPETLAVYKELVRSLQEQYYQLSQTSYLAPSCVDL